jgi:iron complex outermembrane receptor protein
MLAWPSFVQAQQVQSTNIQQLSIEQLANVEVTGVSRRAEPLSQAPAAVFIITAEDIRRSAAGSLVEVLRLAPNLEIARMNGFATTVSVRGFNSPESANKLLVLVDGRSVYSPLASTVFWENVDVPLADILRIEVISGPGGTLYGANAVNGVINIITKNAAETQGGFLDARVGQSGGYRTMLRYGFSPWEGGAVRLYGQIARNGGTEPVTLADMSKTGWVRNEGGFRFDQVLGADTFNLSGDIYANHSPQQAVELGRGANLNGKWERVFESGSRFSGQAIYDDNVRIIQGSGAEQSSREQLQTYELDLQNNTSLGFNDSFIWGGTYRQSKEAFYTSGLFRFADPTTTISIANIFAQEEFPFSETLKATAGLKLEQNSYSGLDVMPNVRLAWQATGTDMFWAAISRSVRTPSKIDRELEASSILLPAPNFASEHLTAFELGYRGEPIEDGSISLSAFYNRYGNLRSDQATPSTVLPIILVNGVEGDTFGIDLSAKYAIAPWWRVTGGFSWLSKAFHTKPGFTDFALGQSEGQDPALLGQLRSYMNVFDNWELDSAVRYVGQVVQDSPNVISSKLPLVPEYVEADLRIGWHITNSTDISFSVLNLFHNRHLEANDPSTYSPQYVPRSFIINLRQSF